MFPFLDLSRSKLRPALVLADAGKGDWVLSQITSKSYSDTQAIKLLQKDFLKGRCSWKALSDRISHLRLMTHCFTTLPELLQRTSIVK